MQALDLVSYDHQQSDFTLTPHISHDFCFQQNAPVSIWLAPVPSSQSSSSTPVYASSSYKLGLFARAGSMRMQGHTYPVIEEDYYLMQKICADNPHYKKEQLWKILLTSSVINQASMIVNGDRPLHCFAHDVYINPDHFRSLSDATFRMNLLTTSAQKAMKERHTQERDCLKNNQKWQTKQAKHQSKSEKNKLAAQHTKAWNDLEQRQEQEKKHPLGMQQKPTQVAPSTTNSQPPPAMQSSNINHQNLQTAVTLHQNLLSSTKNYGHEFQKIMQERSQAFASSLNDARLTQQNISIQAQTTGFLQAQGIDALQFQTSLGLPIQHQLSHELASVLDAVADYALHHQAEIYQRNLTSYCAHLALQSQQSNQLGILQQAIDGTNCCHGMQHYLQGMASTVADGYHQFQTALHYFDTVLDTYGNLILQHGLQGAIVAHGLEALVTAGMLAAPTTTVAATAGLIAATTYVMAPLCLQAMVDTAGFAGACIVGDWNTVATDLDTFGSFVSNPITIARLAEFAGGAAMPTPNMNMMIEHVMSLRPVITKVQQASGHMAQSLYLMSKNQVRNVYAQGMELLQQAEFANFNLLYENIMGCHFFDILPRSYPALVAALQGFESNLLTTGEQMGLSALLTQTESAIVGDLVKGSAAHSAQQVYQVSQEILLKNFAQIDTGQKMIQAITKPYEEIMFKNIAKQYDKLIANHATSETIHLFCTCQELSIVPKYISDEIAQLHTTFHNKYLGLPEFQSANQYLTIQMIHIFYPSLQPKLDPIHQQIESITLNGFHHDEYNKLEKSGLFNATNKMYGRVEFGAEECFIANLDFGNGILCKEKTFFPASWSKEKTAQVIFEASQNKIKDLTLPSHPYKKYLCQGVNNILIEIVINLKNTIISAYPSLENFIIGD